MEIFKKAEDSKVDGEFICKDCFHIFTTDKYIVYLTPSCFDKEVLTHIYSVKCEKCDGRCAYKGIFREAHPHLRRKYEMDKQNKRRRKPKDINRLYY